MANIADGGSAGITEPKGHDRYFQDRFNQYNNWSRYYHDAEIRVNSTALFLSTISALVSLIGGPQRFQIAGGYNLVGVVIVIVSAAALVSTIGYWRYYELTDLIAKTFRSRYIPEDVLKPIESEFENAFRQTFPTLSRPVFVHAHHAIWIVIQCISMILGAFIFFAGVPIPPPGGG